jgi:predicted DNA-binding transcriptional regulator YafY
VRRADRLFAIIQTLRGGRLRTAEWLGQKLEVSARTIYRDIADLQSNGVPIDGERGVGYLLRDDYFVPALALKPLEMEALRWGVGLATTHADDALAEAARDVLAKLNIRPMPSPIFSVRRLSEAQRIHLARAREAIKGSLRMELSYRSLGSIRSSRFVRPLSLEHWGEIWTLTGWCELREDFRVFRIDGIEHSRTLERFIPTFGKRIDDYLARLAHLPSLDVHRSLTRLP